MFVEVALKREQEEYLAEGVEWTQVDKLIIHPNHSCLKVGFFSNSVICHLVEQSSVGLLSLLDEASAHFSPSSDSPSDLEFLASASSSLASHPHFEAEGSSSKPGANPVPAHSFR